MFRQLQLKWDFLALCPNLQESNLLSEPPTEQFLRIAVVSRDCMLGQLRDKWRLETKAFPECISSLQVRWRFTVWLQVRQVTSLRQTAEFSSTPVDGFLFTSKFLLNSCSNNTIEVNLLEICEKELFNYDKIDATTSETDSAAGRVAASL